MAAICLLLRPPFHYGGVAAGNVGAKPTAQQQGRSDAGCDAGACDPRRRGACACSSTWWRAGRRARPRPMSRSAALSAPASAAPSTTARSGLRHLAAARRRVDAARARADPCDWAKLRRERTRHLIELGGLAQKTGFVELLDNDRATLLGLLLDAADRLHAPEGEPQREGSRQPMSRADLLARWRRRGLRAFNANAAAAEYAFPFGSAPPSPPAPPRPARQISCVCPGCGGTTSRSPATISGRMWTLRASGSGRFAQPVQAGGVPGFTGRLAYTAAETPTCPLLIARVGWRGPGPL